MGSAAKKLTDVEIWHLLKERCNGSKTGINYKSLMLTV